MKTRSRSGSLSQSASDLLQSIGNRLKTSPTKPHSEYMSHPLWKSCIGSKLTFCNLAVLLHGMADEVPEEGAKLSMEKLGADLFSVRVEGGKGSVDDSRCDRNKCLKLIETWMATLGATTYVDWAEKRILPHGFEMGITRLDEVNRSRFPSARSFAPMLSAHVTPRRVPAFRREALAAVGDDFSYSDPTCASSDSCSSSSSSVESPGDRSSSYSSSNSMSEGASPMHPPVEPSPPPMRRTRKKMLTP